MEDTTRRPPPPLELLKLRSATTAYLKILDDVAIWAQQAADVNAIRDVRYRELYDELIAARRPFPRLAGTPAAIGRVCAELLGEE